MAYSDLVVGAESGGNPNATNENSSASGAAGFTNGTWLETVRKNRPDLADKPDSDLLALKADPVLSGQMADAYGNANGAILAKAGLPVTDATKYLAHFAGPGGAVGLLNADPNTPAGSVLGPAVVKANPFLANMTAGDVAAWASRKMGGPPAPMSMGGPPAAPQSAPTAPAPTPQAAPQQAAASPQVDLNALAAVPHAQLANILRPTPNPFRLKIAPFSLGG